MSFGDFFVWAAHLRLRLGLRKSFWSVAIDVPPVEVTTIDNRGRHNGLHGVTCVDSTAVFCYVVSWYEVSYGRDWVTVFFMCLGDCFFFRVFFLGGKGMRFRASYSAVFAPLGSIYPHIYIRFGLARFSLGYILDIQTFFEASNK